MSACDLSKVTTHMIDQMIIQNRSALEITNLSKISGCEAIAEWVKPCTNHLYWSARITQ